MALPVQRSVPPSSVGRWDPFQELDDLHSRLEGLVQSALPGTGSNGAIWTPPVDIEETEDAWIVEADLPGAERGDINVEARGNEVLVSGEIKERERKGILRRRTRRTGEFELRVTVPGEADGDRVDASLDHGVLTVRIPKPEQARTRRIEVQSGGENASPEQAEQREQREPAGQASG